ncbi:MAG: STAS domain-containing protein [Holosporales bacterium]|jgi:anti-anti-sigma factor|nr:STAS domain-containing protein [Holosporales bacterium]
MEFEQTSFEKGTILKPKGRIDTVSSRAFEEKLSSLLDTEGCTHLIISLEHVDYISSAGLRIFLMIGKKLKSAGGGFVLCCMAERILDVFRMSGFDKIILISTTLEEAQKAIA